MNLLLLYRIKCLPKNTNGRLAIPALAGLLVLSCLNLGGTLSQLDETVPGVIFTRFSNKFQLPRPLLWTTEEAINA